MSTYCDANQNGNRCLQLIFGSVDSESGSQSYITVQNRNLFDCFVQDALHGP